MMTPNELNYSPIEKICLTLIFTIQKLNHYFQAHTVRLISKANPLKYVMTRPIIYVPQKAVKGQVLTDFLVDHPIPAEWELSDDLPDEDVLVIEITPPWKMYFDGASHKNGAGAGVIFITSDGEVLPYSFTLIQNCSNNVAEYQALILGLEMAVDIKQLHLKVYGDSKLVVNQLLGLYEVKKPELLPYFNYVRRLIGWLGDVIIKHIPRTDNKQADALANLASTLAMPEGEARVPICRSWVVPPIFEDENYDEDEENHFSFKQRKSSMYYAAANGLAEAFNKTLCTLLKKVITKSKRDWHERIEEALWAYRTTFRMPTQATPYALGQQIPSLRIAIQEGLMEKENAHLRLEELEALDEKRLEAQQRLECYQARLSRAFNKKVRSRSFQVGDLVLAVRRPIITTHRTGNKFTSKWDGPYVVKEVYTNGAYKLVAEDGLNWPNKWTVFKTLLCVKLEECYMTHEPKLHVTPDLHEYKL
ncbi:hypothetical protein Pfo_022574 [Paulownia fortunei]|nr:hypothetical protein Pfo_022574 [Paulownia fortunei]